MEAVSITSWILVVLPLIQYHIQVCDASAGTLTINVWNVAERVCYDDTDVERGRNFAKDSVADQVTIDTNAKVLGVQALCDDGSPGIVAHSRDYDLVTDDSWKCTNSQPDDNWCTADYDDSNWERAYQIRTNTISGIPTGTPWIWHSSPQGAGPSDRAWCRRDLTRVSGHISVNDYIENVCEDGTNLGSGMEGARKWNEASQITIAKDTAVIGIEGRNGAGQLGGIIGSFKGLNLLTDDWWKCTATRPPNDWCKIWFLDSQWVPFTSSVLRHEWAKPMTYIKIDKIDPEAKWIWVADQKNKHVWCRKVLRPELMTTAAPTIPPTKGPLVYPQVESGLRMSRALDRCFYGHCRIFVDDTHTWWCYASKAPHAELRCTYEEECYFPMKCYDNNIQYGSLYRREGITAWNVRRQEAPGQCSDDCGFCWFNYCAKYVPPADKYFCLTSPSERTGFWRCNSDDQCPAAWKCFDAVQISRSNWEIRLHIPGSHEQTRIQQFMSGAPPEILFIGSAEHLPGVAPSKYGQQIPARPPPKLPAVVRPASGQAILIHPVDESHRVMQHSRNITVEKAAEAKAHV